MHRRITKIAALAATAAVTVAAVATAAVTIDENGYGFVGKGDVQTAFGWNNKQLQDNAEEVAFTVVKSVTEVSWICTNSNNDNTQLRKRTTTTQGVLAAVARDKKQITGFTLEGFDGSAGESESGNPLNSCPSGPWTLTTPAGDPQVVEGADDEVYASYDGGPLVLLNPPVEE